MPRVSRTARFTLTVIDEDHMILATEERMRPDEFERTRDAFDRWKDQGGALIVAECLMVDRHAVTVDLDLEVPDGPEEG